MQYQAKDIIFDKDARSRIAAGANKVARAVISTLGPQSKNVAIHMGNSSKVIHDGVSVAREIRLKDKFEDLGCMMIREASVRTNDLAGDGTTTAMLLANTLFQEGLKLIDNTEEELLTKKQGVNAMDLRRALLAYADLIVAEIEKKYTKKIKTQEDLIKVATLSAADPDLGKLIADAWKKIGINGQVLVETTTENKDGIEHLKGYSFDNGFLSPYFMTDTNRYISSYEEAYVLFADYIISQPNQIIPIVSEVFEISANKRPLIIICNDCNGAALNALIKTKMRLGYELCVVMAPEWAERRQQALDDMALLTGGVVANPQTLPIEQIKVNQLGRVKNVLITQRDTVFTPDNPDEQEIKVRVQEIKNQIKNEKTEWIIDKHKERLARLSQSIAILKLSAASDIELHDKRERAIDAVFATRAALEDGYVLGGGMTLYHIAENIPDLKDVFLPEAYELVKFTLMQPFHTLMENSGINPIYALEEIGKDTLEYGYDVVSRKRVRLFDAGIIDPVKVTKLAVRHAFSVAATVITTACSIVDIDEEKK